MRPHHVLALVALGACLSCKSQKTPPGVASGPAAETSASARAAGSSSATSTLAEVEPPRRRLEERAPIDRAVLAKPRKVVLAALATARQKIAQHHGSEAIDALRQVRASDPNGSAVGLALADALRDSGDAKAADRAARAARRDFPHATAPASAKKSAASDLGGACGELVEAVRAGNVSLVRGDPGGTWAELHCAPEYMLTVSDKAMKRVTALRVEGDETTGEVHARHAIAWVALETANGIVVYGPVAEAVTVRSPDLTNDFVVDLQRIDVLPGGAPEVVVKVNEIATYADVAANELAEAEESHAFLLTIDRGNVEASRDFVLESRVARSALNAADNAPLPGSKRSPDLGKPVDYQMKVAWGGPNVITLSKAGGNGTPRDSGELTLFP